MRIKVMEHTAANWTLDSTHALKSQNLQSNNIVCDLHILMETVRRERRRKRERRGKIKSQAL